ncbi:hypothetical protein BT96DRAFT_926811 [Gymnopus androsaceus JB14]|uniref:Uncharacterized protein n=1 Tax=Gymnopus androsaceus JB14 TaxID=1447944 RepID=A0A6A4GV28_9AGAR|nr:hypothetical protein BT96DRAFT_926811 [Gymnopus androsaceus JB14]
MVIFKVDVGKEVLLDVRESSRALKDCPDPSLVGFMCAIEEIWGAALGTDHNSQPESYGRTFQ